MLWVMARGCKRWLRVVLLAVCGVAVFAAAGSAMTSRLHDRGAVTRAASCPPGGEAAVEKARSTRVSGAVLAPTGTLWTTICGSNDHGVLKGGPVDAALNSAGKPPPPHVCPQWIETPFLAILAYKAGTRQFVVQFSGCGDVVILHDGTRLTFTAQGVKQLSAAFERAG